MKKNIFNIITTMGIPLLFSGQVLAQGMMGFSSSSPDSVSIQSQQQEGKKLFDDLSNKTITCSQITDSDFEKIGEYFMGQSIGDTSRQLSLMR